MDEDGGPDGGPDPDRYRDYRDGRRAGLKNQWGITRAGSSDSYRNRLRVHNQKATHGLPFIFYPSAFWSKKLVT